ncbi:MAG TPA: ferritin-like domain-containing protein [Egibacteraceae bacterium]|nr:ferritin-like domain-containing protein [Egibacteraceae bacterium]
MTQRIYAMPTEITGWTVPGVANVQFNWEYDAGRDKLLSLYEKGKNKQWNTNERIDWSIEIDLDDTSGMPDEYVPLFGSPMWDKLDRAGKNQVRHHYGAWLNSQFLHGEQGALICAARIVETVPDIDAKWYGATQVMDEARHVETYARYLHEKLNLAYPINPHLKELLNQTLTDTRWDMTYLGMQIMIEGVALAAFSMIRDFTGEPLSKAINAYVMQDEARHVAFGLLALKDAYAEMTSAEKAEREEFVVEASYLLRDRFLAREVWENLGFDADECVEYVNNHQMLGEFRKALFSRVVPNVKKIGLWGPKVQEAFVDMGVIQFQDMDPDESFARDESIAEELDRLMEQGRHKEIRFMWETDAEQVAETIAVGATATDEEAKSLGGSAPS